MNRYRIIVRDYNYSRPSDEYLIRTGRYYISPAILLDLELNAYKSYDMFEKEYKQYFLDFINPHYEAIPVDDN